MLIGLLLVVAAVAGLVMAEKRESRRLKWLFKPLASTGFVIVGLRAGGFATPYGRWILAGLVLGWVGDVLLLGPGKAAFMLGLGSFLLGHAAFGAAFVRRGVSWPVVLVAAITLAPAARALWSWLGPHVPASLRVPVMVYLGVIATMVALAAGASWARPGWVIVAAALMFALSDVSVARDRFLDAGWSNKAWGLPLYYAAQCVLALSVLSSVP
jgi:uncharacterized membrane protein YhhN